MSGDVTSVNATVIAARRLLEEGFGNGDLSVVDECVADDFIEHQNDARASARTPSSGSSPACTSR
jgi:hypothetical protein